MTKRNYVKPGYMKAGPMAEYLSISRRHLHDLTARGRIPYVRLSQKCLLYKISDIEALMEKLTVKANNFQDRSKD